MLDHFVVGRGRAHLARSAGTGRPLRARGVSARRRRQRRAQRRGARRPRRDRRPRRTTTRRGAADRGAARRARHRRIAGSSPIRARGTTRKLRVVTTRNQQVARIDYEDDGEVSGAVGGALVDRDRARCRRASTAILVSDYQKGVGHARGSRTAAIAAARGSGIPLLVDPKVPHIDYYAGATLITPNHHEAEAVTHMRIRTIDEARRRGAALPRARPVRQRARDPRRARHVAARRERRSRAERGGARGVGRDRGRRHRHRHDGAGARRRGLARSTRRGSPIGPPGLSSASSGRPRSRVAELDADGHQLPASSFRTASSRSAQASSTAFVHNPRPDTAIPLIRKRTYTSLATRYRTCWLEARSRTLEVATCSGW